MVLAAGEGTRLRPLTDDRPKPMIEIAGAPILEHNVRLLAAHGVKEIVVNLHYKPEAIEHYFGDGSRFGVSIVYSHEEHLLGTAGGLKKMERAFTGGDFFLVYGDNLTTLDLGALAAHHRERGAVLTMALFEREDPRQSGIVGLDGDDRIVRFLEKPKDDEIFSHWVNAGFLVLSPRLLDAIPAGRPSDFGRDVVRELLARNEPVYGYRMSEPLWWIDSVEDYERTRREAPALLHAIGTL